MEQCDNFLMRHILWSFIAPKYSTKEDFYQMLKYYNEEIDNKIISDNIINGIGNEIVVQYEYWDNDKDDTIEDELQIMADGILFTEIELLYKIHNLVCEKLQYEDNHFFEGLQLYEGENPNAPDIPYYFLMQGS